MKALIADERIRVVILDISGVYVQIHDQGYFLASDIPLIQHTYSNSAKWKVIIFSSIS